MAPEAIARAIEGKPVPAFVEPATPGGEVADAATGAEVLPCGECNGIGTVNTPSYVGVCHHCEGRKACRYQCKDCRIAGLRRALAASEEARKAAERDACGEACENAVAARDQYAEALTNAAAAVGCEEEWSNLHEHGDCILNGIAALQADRDRLAVELVTAREELEKADLDSIDLAFALSLSVLDDEAARKAREEALDSHHRRVGDRIDALATRGSTP